MAFLAGSGTVTLIGEDRGEWNAGVWYSDSSYRRVVPRGKVRSLPAAVSYPCRRWETGRAALKEEAHRLLEVNGEDLTSWNDHDLAVLADAYPPGGGEGEREAVAV